MKQKLILVREKLLNPTKIWSLKADARRIYRGNMNTLLKSLSQPKKIDDSGKLETFFSKAQ